MCANLFVRSIRRLISGRHDRAAFVAGMALVPRVFGLPGRTPVVAPISTLPTLGNSLSLAMIASSDAPLLLLDGDLGVIAASHSFCSAFHIELAGVAGSSVFALGAG